MGLGLHALVDQSPDPMDLDLKDLVPPRGRIDHVWYVPAGRTLPEVVVAWSHRGRPVVSVTSDTRYALTVWRPRDVTPGTARWTPQTLFENSPFPLSGRSVRTADVTHDAHRDLLVTVECDGCNHGVSAVSIYTDSGARMRQIYGRGFLDGSKGEHLGVSGQVITETAWGAWRGLVWFDEPGGRETSVCCPQYRLQIFLRWRHGGWQTVMRRKLSPEHDHYLGQRPFPAP
ncbi:MAG TPA: hypothetical protein VGM80_16730 [Gaiellaceae bacterium]